MINAHAIETCWLVVLCQLLYTFNMQNILKQSVNYCIDCMYFLHYADIVLCIQHVLWYFKSYFILYGWVSCNFKWILLSNYDVDGKRRLWPFNPKCSSSSTIHHSVIMGYTKAKKHVNNWAIYYRSTGW